MTEALELSPWLQNETALKLFGFLVELRMNYPHCGFAVGPLIQLVQDPGFVRALETDDSYHTRLSLLVVFHGVSEKFCQKLQELCPGKVIELTRFNNNSMLFSMTKKVTFWNRK